MKRLIALVSLLVLGGLLIVPPKPTEARVQGTVYWAFVNISGHVIKVNNVQVTPGAYYNENASCSVTQTGPGQFSMVRYGTGYLAGPGSGSGAGTVGFTAIWIDE